MAEPIRIRVAERGDGPALLGMIEALTRHHADVPRQTLASLERDLFGGRPWYHTLVAVQHSQVVGYAAALPLGRLGYGARGLDLHHLFVVPAARKQGAGQALVRGIEDLAHDLGCSYVIIGTHPDNAEAQAYYQRLGYAPHVSLARRFTKTIGAGGTS